ncbi:MAG: hypothetical protein KTR31_30860 [Myxococcales bacterium]|nr:hypothetical protein [Myxococcales bacterium]
MSEFHYVRTPGSDGGVDAAEGPAIGLELHTVLSDGLPPWKVALEIIAALCEILDIADEDSESHGQVDPRSVFIDETGAVSLEGFGVRRPTTNAPEQDLQPRASDLYGVGYTALCTVSSVAPALPLQADSPEGHDDLVIDAAVAIDLSDLPEDMHGDVQWFIAKLMSHDPEQRPSALEAWRTFVAFAAELEGPDITQWCAAAIDRGGERRQEQGGDDHTVEEAATVEALDAPSVTQGPMATAVPFDGGGAPTGDRVSTAFWTRSDMRRALMKDAVREAGGEGPPMGVGGGSATNFWTREQLAAMARGDQAAPRPKRAVGTGKQRTGAMQRAKSYTPGKPKPSSDLLPTDPDVPEDMTSFVPRIRRPDPPPVTKRQATPPEANPETVEATVPSAEPPPTLRTSLSDASSSTPSTPSGARRRGTDPARLRVWVFGGGVAAFASVVAVLVLLFAVIAGLAYVRRTQPIVPPIQADARPVEPEPPKPPPPVVVPDAKRRPTAPKSRPRSSPRVRPAKPAPTPSAAPSSEPQDARVSLTANSPGTLSGCGPETLSFDSRKSFTVEGYRLPATCLVTMGKAREVFQVFGSGTIHCELVGDRVLCNRPRVP